MAERRASKPDGAVFKPCLPCHLAKSHNSQNSLFDNHLDSGHNVTRLGPFMKDVVQIRGDLPFRQVRWDHGVVIPASPALAIYLVDYPNIALAPKLNQEPAVDVEPKVLSSHVIAPQDGGLGDPPPNPMIGRS